MNSQLIRFRWLLLPLAGLVLIASTGILYVALQHTQGHTRPLPLSADSVNGIDPTVLNIDPASYDTRMCRQLPSDDTCTGKYPLSPPHVDPTFGAQQGGGACIDQSSKEVENQPLTDGNGRPAGSLQLWWLPSCLSWFARVSSSFPLDQVTSASICVQTESYDGFQQFMQLPPSPINTVETGPVSGRTLLDAGSHTLPTMSVAPTGPVSGGRTISSVDGFDLQLYSPLIYSPSVNVSAAVLIDLTNAPQFWADTCAYAAGVKQYCNVTTCS